MTAVIGFDYFKTPPQPQRFKLQRACIPTIAGWFYGRAWRSERRLAALAVCHTMVDSVWVTWFLAT